MHLLNGLAFSACLLASSQVFADGIPDVPPNYPSHLNIGDCNQQSVRTSLNNYNNTRLDVAPVLRHLAESDASIPPSSREQLVKYANNLESMRTNLPDPDPDSTEFRNFDFHLGLTFTAMVVYLNTNDERLAARFVAERDNPNSELGQYLVRLDQSRENYMHDLDHAKSAGCSS